MLSAGTPIDSPSSEIPVEVFTPDAIVPVRREPTHDEIAREAYALYEARGREDGWQVEDWLAAEEALRSRLETFES